MLELLKIKNIAIIDSAEIPFKKGLNILSGETGAGKSIILEAISLLLGSRAHSELVRSECDEGVVEGVFNTSEIPWIGERLESFGFSHPTSELIIKRSVNRSGKHRISINGELANLSTLQHVCEGLIDLCGQHEHQSLLKSQTQLDLLDRFGGLTDRAQNLVTAWTRVSGFQKALLELQEAEYERNQRFSFLKFQIEEIQTAQLTPGEDEALQQEKHLLQSANHRVQAAENVRDLLESDENGVLNLLKGSLLKIRPLFSMDPRVGPLTESIERALAETEEVLLGLHRYLNLVGGELDEEKLQALQERLSLLADLRRKYGKTTDEILAHLERLTQEANSLEDTGGEIQRITALLCTEEEQLKKNAKKLGALRKKVSDLLSQSVTAELKDLKMGEAKLSIEIEHHLEFSDWNHAGADTIQFVVQTNRGEPARPLGKIASGGELSRLMLAIRRVIADRGGIGVYLFDEIDAGIGGQTAFQVGKKLKSVASYNQVICITHLPQVAAFADHHLVVQKVSSGKRTITEIKPLKKPERKEELARMLGGPQLTRKSVENASELLDLAQR